jgi:hypothetical protein
MCAEVAVLVLLVLLAALHRAHLVLGLPSSRAAVVLQYMYTSAACAECRRLAIQQNSRVVSPGRVLGSLGRDKSTEG